MSKTPAVVRLSDTLSNVNFSELISNAFGAFGAGGGGGGADSQHRGLGRLRERPAGQGRADSLLSVR